MRRSHGLLVLVLVVVVAGAAAIWLWSRSRTAPRPASLELPAPVQFGFTDVTVDSPDLDVGPADVRGAVASGHTSWIVEMVCEEPAGCTGSLRVELRFESGSGEQRIAIGSSVDVPSGGPMRFEGLQDPPATVATITRVSLEVRSRGTPGQTREIPW